MVERFLQDLRFGLRMMTKSPGFTSVAVLTLALGIGANSAIFSVIHAVLLKPLPFAAPERMVTLYEQWKSGEEGSLSSPDFQDIRDQNRSFDGVAAFMAGASALTGDREPTALHAVRATANLFSVLGVRPLLGRGFSPEDDVVGAPPVAVLGHELWQKRFAADPHVLGRRIQLDGKSFTVVGVMPAFMRYPYDCEMWIPLSSDPHAVVWSKQGRDWHYLQAVGRLRSDVSLTLARQDMTALALALQKQYPKSNEDIGFAVVSLQEYLVGANRPALLVLMAAVAFILLIACANVAGLLMARSTSRQREVAIRLALGAGRVRLVQQLLTESVLLALLGGGLGVLLSLWGVDLLSTTVLSNVPRVNEVRVDGVVLGATALVAIATGLVFGLAPAFAATRPALHAMLKEGGRQSGSVRQHRLQGALVVAQVALALVLLASAGLMVRSVARLERVNPGFQPEHVSVVRLALPEARYDQETSSVFYRRVLTELERLPGVVSVGLARPSPFDGNDSSLGIRVKEGDPPIDANDNVSPVTHFVNRDYFATLGIPIRAGRAFTTVELERRADVVMINERLARRYWPKESPVGKHLMLGLTKRWYEIIGVVGDVKQNALDEPAPLQTYFPYPLDGVAALGKTLLVRSSVPPATLSSQIRDLVHALDPLLPLTELKPLTARVVASTQERRSLMTLLGIFAALALLLSGIGLYGVIAYSVTERTHELGIRAALGCQKRAILAMVIARGLRLAALGIGVGLVAAFWATRLLDSLLFGVKANDPSTFALIPVVLLVVAVLASYLPAARATKVDPMTALRAE